MEINKPLTNTEVQPEARAVLVVPENPAVPAVWVVLAVLEDPAVRAALAVSESPAVPVVRAVLAVLEDPAVRAVLENPAVRAVSESPAVPAVPAAAVLAPVLEEAHVPEVGPVRCRRRSPAAAVAPTVSAVINPQGVVAAAPSAEEAGRLPKRPAVVVAPAWEVAEVVVEEEAVGVEAEEDADAKRAERTRNIET